MPKRRKGRLPRRGKEKPTSAFLRLASELAEIGRAFYGRGWVLGTSGNFSAVLAREPVRIAITVSGADKGALLARHVVEIDGDANLLAGVGRPSSEAILHLTLARTRGVGAVLHTHSVWSTVLSEEFAARGGLEIAGYEMLKGLDGISTHEHREWLPILENSQEMARLSRQMEEILQRFPSSHGFLVRGHGLYTWGSDLAEARRHVEILEFLLEVLGRRQAASDGLAQMKSAVPGKAVGAI